MTEPAPSEQNPLFIFSDKLLYKRVEHQKTNGELKTEEAVEAYKKQYKAKMFAESIDNPYLELKSSSNNNLYRVFIKLGELKSSPIMGEFNRFGLSKMATVLRF